MVSLPGILLTGGTPLLLAAERRELQGVLRSCQRWKRLNWPVQFSAEAVVSGRRVLLAANGAGPRCARKAAAAARERDKFTMVVSTGFCGALHPRWSVGKIVAAQSVAAPQLGRVFPASAVRSARSFEEGHLLSVDRVVVTVAERRELFSEGHEAVEMEAAAVAECAESWRLPFWCVRVVSDSADHEFALDLNRFRDAEGRFQNARIAWAAVRSPWKVGADLRRLQRQSLQAAEVLGEFLGDCEF